MNPLQKYINEYNDNIPLTYHYVNILKSKKKINKSNKKSIKLKKYQTDFYILFDFHKSISKTI
jgi:hypothetical protein